MDDDTAPAVSATSETPQGKYMCRGCGYRDDTKWYDVPCPRCGIFYDIIPKRGDGAGKQGLAKLAFKPVPRQPTGIASFDKILGGPDGQKRFGMVRGDTVVLAGPRGGGKSTLASWICGNTARAGLKALFVTGEDSREKVAAIFGRQQIFEGLSDDEIAQVEARIDVIAEDDVYKIVEHIKETKPDFVVIDSAQMVQVPDVKADHGMNAQVKAVMDHLTWQNKFELKVALLVISQVTSDGGTAGGTAAQHACDAIFHFIPAPPEEVFDLDEAVENFDPAVGYLALFCDGKNRNGNANGECFFEMTESGRLVEVRRRSPLEVDGGDDGRGRRKKKKGLRLV